MDTIETQTTTGSRVERERMTALFARERVDALQKGLASYLDCFEVQAKGGFMPQLTTTEGVMIAGIFERSGANLREFEPAQPEGRTESAVMAAVREDLKEVFGEEIGKKAEEFVKEKVQPLRKKAGQEEKKEEEGEEANRFLVMAVENTLRDLVAVARAFQWGEGELQEAALANFSFSLFSRLTKGKFRQQGFCDRSVHQEHVWMIRGLRDLPPGSGAEIGAFVEQLLSPS